MVSKKKGYKQTRRKSGMRKRSAEAQRAETGKKHLRQQWSEERTERDEQQER